MTAVVAAPSVPGLTAPPAGRTLVLGVVNTTPDSFSDGGSYPDAAAAVRHGLALAAAGADLVDVGGESTRPGAVRVDAAEEQRRVVPVIRALAAEGVAVSVDTMRAATAEAAVAAGAVLVNDVSGGLGDPAMAGVVADLDVPYVLMHWRGHSDVMTSLATYGDVVADVRAELEERVGALLAAGVRRERLVLDPGLGFAKDADHGWALLAGLDRLAALGLPLLVGASRKRMLGTLLAAADGTPRPADGRDAATAAVTALVAAQGVWGVRVHDVAPSADAVLVAARWRGAATTPSSAAAGR
jgi:dihydropteroate synthase